MKPGVGALLAAIVVFRSGAAWGASVDIGVVDGQAGVQRWMAGAPAAIPTGEISCAPAKFNKISTCPTIVIFNHCGQAVTLSFTSNSEDFAVGEHQFFQTARPPQPCYQGISSWSLKPGERCYAPVIFWPRTGEVHHATIYVSAAGLSEYTSASFRFEGTSDYPPRLRAAEEVRQRHAAELMKIPHVASVELDDKNGIKIDVTVSDWGLTPEMLQQCIQDVRRQVPRKIEGYDTEVTQYVWHAYAD